MENNSLLIKLNDLEARFQEISTLITDPAVVADMKRYVRLNKEYRELEQILDARKRYVQLLTSLAEAKDLLANENDTELREMAREEIDMCETEIPKTEEEIKILLIPLCCGLGYELIRICGRHNNIITKIIAAPGLWIQRLTTKEPDDSMIECALAAFLPVIPENSADDEW